jgi:hypothetical protein
MIKGARVRWIYLPSFMGTIVSEIDPYDPRVLVKWDRPGKPVWVDTNDIEAVPPLKLLAEQAE